MLKACLLVECSMRYSKMLEESTFHGKRAEYCWLLIVSCTFLLVRVPTFLPSLFSGPVTSLAVAESTLRVNDADPEPFEPFTVPIVSTLVHGKLSKHLGLCSNLLLTSLSLYHLYVSL